MAITFEQFVAMRVGIERRASRAAVLSEHGISAIQWQAGQRRWLRELVREAERGGERYGERYRRALGMLGEGGALPTATLTEAVGLSPPTAAVADGAAFPVFYVPDSAIARHAPLGVDVTVAGEMPTIGDEPLPFRDGGAQAPPALAAAEVAAEGADMAGETTFFTALTDEQLADGTPLDGRPSDSDSLAESVDETAFFTALVFDEDPLPFERSAEGAAPTPMVHTAHDLAGQTAIGPALSDADRMSLPFGKADAAPQSVAASGQLSLEQYASLRAEIDHLGAVDRGAVLVRYGLPSDDAFVALKRHWAEHFRAAPADYGRFRAAHEAYARWLAERR